MTPDEVRALDGRPVRAKRLGWDDPPEGRVTDRDEFEPAAWRDEGLPAEVAGVLEVEDFAVAGETATAYRVGGAAVDPATIRPDAKSGDWRGRSRGRAANDKGRARGGAEAV